MNVRTMLSVTALVLTLGLVSATARAAETYELDLQHSYAAFEVMHLGIAPSFGSFAHVEGSVTLDDASPAATSFQVKIKVETVDTHVDKRDQHLRSPDFFNAKQFPWMTFSSTKVAAAKDGFQVTGDLTIKGVTKPITVHVKKTGEGDDPWGNHRAGFYTEFTVKRSDFGITFMPKVVGDEVTIRVSVEGIRK